MLVTGAEPKNPVKNLVIIIVCTSLAVAVAKEKMAARKYGGKTAVLRPYSSDRGAQISGPNPRPNKSNEVPSVATSFEMPNSSLICAWPVE